MSEQFLTLMADFDDESQKKMGAWYNELKETGLTGTQTPGLPYHISLKTFSPEQENDVIAEMERLAGEYAPIPVHISHIGVFSGGRVLFGAPDMGMPYLLSLYDAIDVATGDRFPWTPHVTILIDEPEAVKKAFGIWSRSFRPFLGKITRLHLCAFRPMREIAVIDLKKK